MVFTKMNGRSIRKLDGNVIVEHGKNTMYCDRALIDPKANKMEAFGNVKVKKKGENFETHSDYLDYDGNSFTAILRGKAKIVTQKLELLTEEITLNTKTNEAFFYTSGVVKSPSFVLTCDGGKNHSKTQTLEFIGNVVLKSDDFILKNDRLFYETESHNAYFREFTTIETEESTVFGTSGNYNSEQKHLHVTENAKILSGKYMFTADTLLYVKDSPVLYLRSNAKLRDTTQSGYMAGNLCVFNREKKILTLTKNAFMTNSSNENSVYIAGDTIKMKQDSIILEGNTPPTKTKQIDIFYNVVVFSKNQLSAICDSVHYFSPDSTIYLMGDAVVWSGKHQILSDHIEIKLTHDTLSHVDFMGSPMIVSENKDSDILFNQVKGKSLRGFFSNGSIYKFRFKKKVSSIYFVAEKKTGIYMGMNTITGEEMTALLDSVTILKITFRKNTNAKLTPLFMLKKKICILEILTGTLLTDRHRLKVFRMQTDLNSH